MKHVTSAVPAGELDRLRALRDRAPEGRYRCTACLDTGLLYFTRVVYGRQAKGVAPCTECAAGAARHLDGNVCIWARGNRACCLCGAREGEQVPAGFKPSAPAGWIPYQELPTGRQ